MSVCVMKVIFLLASPSLPASITGRTAQSWCKPQSWCSATCSRVRSLEAPSTSQAVFAFLPTARTAWRSAGSQSRPRRRTPQWAPRRGTCPSIGRPPTWGCRCHTSSGRPRRGAWDRSPGALCPAASTSRPQNQYLSRGVCSPVRCSWQRASAPRPDGGWVGKHFFSRLIWLLLPNAKKKSKLCSYGLT